MHPLGHRKVWEVGVQTSQEHTPPGSQELLLNTQDTCSCYSFHCWEKCALWKVYCNRKTKSEKPKPQAPACRAILLHQDEQEAFCLQQNVEVCFLFLNLSRSTSFTPSQLKATCQIRKAQKSEAIEKLLCMLHRLMWRVTLKNKSLRLKKNPVKNGKWEALLWSPWMLPHNHISVPSSCGHIKFNFEK